MEAAKDDEGSNVAKFPFVSVTDPAIEVPALFFKVYVDVVTVALCTASLNVAVIEEAIGKPVAPLAGLVLVTVGGVASTELLATYSNGSAIESLSAVKYPCPFPSQIVEGVEPELKRALLMSDGVAPGWRDLYRAAAPVT